MTIASRLRLELRPEVVAAFATASGDWSSLHTDPEFARCTRYRRQVIHGLLPVAALLLRASEEGCFAGGWLRRFACRFAQPCFVGDTLDLLLDEDGGGCDGSQFAFRIVRQGGEPVTTGSVGFERADRPGGGGGGGDANAASVFPDPLVEKQLTLADLTVGVSETLCFRPETAPFLALLEHLEPGASKGPAQIVSNIVAVLPASTLIGMRLPGRFATFDEIEANFVRPCSGGLEINLTGTVDRVMAASGRVRLALEWRQGGEMVGGGKALVMVNSPAPASSSCSALRSAHLGTGILGRVALVTGASRGIGEATAKLLAMNGAKVVVHYFRGRQSAQEIVEDIRSEGGVAIACGADLGAEAEILNMFGEAEAALGGIDILVNNAVAEFSPQPFEELSASDYLRELDVSLFGTHACCKRALLHMRSQRWGKMINVGSVATELPPSGQNKYITVKSALAGYTRSLASELARDNIQVNMVVPRMTETSLLAALPPALLTKLAEESVTGRLLQPVEVAKAILFLASDWAGAISGQRLVLNHGEPPFL